MSAWNAEGPWFDSRSGHNRLSYANSVCLYIIYIYIYLNIQNSKNSLYTLTFQENQVVVVKLFL